MKKSTPSVRSARSAQSARSAVCSLHGLRFKVTGEIERGEMKHAGAGEKGGGYWPVPSSPSPPAPPIF